MLNDLARRVGERFFSDPSVLRPVPNHWVYEYRRQEFMLAIGWLLVSVGLLPVAFIGPAIGDLLGRELGYQAGLDIASGIIGFALAGWLLNAGRMVGMRIYWVIASHPRSIRWKPDIPVRRPGLAARRLFTPTDADTLVQALLATVTTVALLLVNP